MIKRKTMKAKAAKAGKAKAPTLTELEEAKRWQRELLEVSADYPYPYNLIFPDANTAEKEELDDAEYEVNFSLS